MNFWDLYGPSKFLSDIEEGLRSNRAGVVVFPVHRPTGFCTSIAERLGRQGWFRVSLGWTKGEHPLGFLFRELTVEIAPREPQSIALLLERLGSIVILVEDIPASDWPAWKHFLKEYELELRRRGDGRAPLLMCALNGVEKEVVGLNAPAIAIYVWTGVVGELDTQIFIRAQALNLDRPSAEREISNRIVARLSLWDIELAAKLVPLSIRDLSQPEGVLQDLARERKWAKGDACSWSSGTEDLFEGRKMQHSLWLSMNGGHADVLFRVWSAQASWGLLLVEQRRRELAPKAARYLRFPIDVNGEVIDKAQDLEIGPLAHQLVRARCSDVDLMRRVRLLRRVRNALAHVEVVDPALLFDTDLVG